VAVRRRCRGNFDDDNARDYLADVIARFEQFIERILAGDIPEEAMGMDNVLDASEHCLLPTMEIISVLHEALASDYLPRPETIARWAEIYPRQVEPLTREVDPTGYDMWYVTKRRPVVVATFEQAGALQRDQDIRIDCYQLEFLPSLNFYVQRNVEHQTGDQEALDFLRQALPVYLFLPRSDWNRVAAQATMPHRAVAVHREMYRAGEVVVVTNRCPAMVPLPAPQCLSRGASPL
jgi:hypothetical protein